MQTALTGLIAATKAGRQPGEREMKAFERANEVLYSGLGYTAEDVRRDYARLRLHHVARPELAPGPVGELLVAVETPALEAELAQAEAALRAQGIDPDAVRRDDEGDDAE
jgi:hypothetical protein